jgi:hypothetical protein
MAILSMRWATVEGLSDINLLTTLAPTSNATLHHRDKLIGIQSLTFIFCKISRNVVEIARVKKVLNWIVMIMVLFSIDCRLDNVIGWICFTLFQEVLGWLENLSKGLSEPIRAT